MKKSEPVVFVKLSETWNRFTLNENIPASNYLIGLFDGGYCAGDKFFSIYLGAVGVILSNLADEINDKGEPCLLPRPSRCFLMFLLIPSLRLRAFIDTVK